MLSQQQASLETNEEARLENLVASGQQARLETNEELNIITETIKEDHCTKVSLKYFILSPNIANLRGGGCWLYLYSLLYQAYYLLFSMYIKFYLNLLKPYDNIVQNYMILTSWNCI